MESDDADADTDLLEPDSNTAKAQVSAWLRRIWARLREFGSRRGGGLGQARGPRYGGLWVLAAAGLIVWGSASTFISIEPGQVALRVNNATGGQEVVTQPGLIFTLPFGIHDVYVLDASPQTFLMQGAHSVDDLHGQELTVRASDGSNFQFKDTTIIFQILGDRAAEVIRDAGTQDNYRRWMRPFSRSVLRDEFGRESTISVSDPTNFGVATERARARLNQELAAHGIVITSIVTPRPRFNEAYESLIESRNEAENQLSVIHSELERAATDRERTIAEVDRDQNRAMQEKRAMHEATLATAVSEQAKTQQTADTYRIEKVGEGQAKLSAARRQAEELKGQLAAQFRSRRAEIEAFRMQPVERVMQRLGDQLKDVTIAIQPWADDATPSRIELTK